MERETASVAGLHWTARVQLGLPDHHAHRSTRRRPHGAHLRDDQFNVRLDAISWPGPRGRGVTAVRWRAQVGQTAGPRLLGFGYAVRSARGHRRRARCAG
jgi:hypothetical protein